MLLVRTDGADEIDGFRGCAAILLWIGRFDSGPAPRPVDLEDSTIGFSDRLVAIRPVADFLGAVDWDAPEQLAPVGFGPGNRLSKIEAVPPLRLFILEDVLFNVWNFTRLKNLFNKC